MLEQRYTDPGSNVLIKSIFSLLCANLSQKIGVSWKMCTDLLLSSNFKPEKPYL